MTTITKPSSGELYETKRTGKSIKVLTRFTLLSCCLFAGLAKSQANIESLISEETFNDFHQCEKKFEYDVYFLGKKVGYLHRKIKWENSAIETTKATVSSYGKVTFLWLDSTYQQKSAMHYSPQYQRFLTPHFSQKLTGLKSREMTAKMSDNGLSSTVMLDAEVSHYQHKNEDENSVLYDLDTLGAQIRLHLLRGNSRFTLFRQASNKLERYQFKVAGQEVITHKKWGDLTTIKVVETGEHENIVLWFSSKHDHQLVKAELDMIFSPIVWLSHFSKQCDS